MAPKNKNRAQGFKSKKQSGSSSAAVQSPPADPPATTPELPIEAATSQEPPSSTTLEAATPAPPPSISSRLRPLSEGAQDTTSDLPDEAATSRPLSSPTKETPTSRPTSQEAPSSTTTPAGATPAAPPAPSSRLLHLAEGERDIFRLACHTAGGVSAATASLNMMKFEEEDSSASLKHGLNIMASTLPNITSRIGMIQDLAHMKEDKQVMAGIIDSLKDMQRSLDSYSLMTKQLVKKIKQNRGSSCIDRREGSSSSGGGGGGSNGEGGGGAGGVMST